MEWSSVDGFIFDVDGTLYNQKKLRRGMLLRLMAYYGLRIHRMREPYAIYLFRKLREKPECKSMRFDELYGIIERKVGLSSAVIAGVIQRWMFDEPLDLIRKTAYTDLIRFIKRQRENGKKIIIYSDYPASDKLKSLELPFDYMFTFSENGINEQKPSLNVMNQIVNTIKVPSDRLIYVGDRDDKDKKSAEMMQIQYYDIADFLKIIA